MRVALVLLLSGCFGKPGEPHLASDAGRDSPGTGIDAAEMPDAPDIPDCTGATFGNETAVPGLVGVVFGDPAFQNDQLLDIFFTGTNSGYHIYLAHRQNATVPFGAPMMLPFGTVGTTEESGAAPTSDGQAVAFIRQDTVGGEPIGYFATLGAAATGKSDFAFGVWTVVKMPGLEDVPMQSLDLSPTGTTLYWMDMTGNLRVSTWNASTSKFSAGTTMIGSAGYYDPSLSFDGTELFFNYNNATNDLTRASTSDSFSGIGLEATSYTDGDVSPNGTTLVAWDSAFSRAVMYTRGCQ